MTNKWKKEGKTMLYRILKHLIEVDQTDGLGEKIDIFYALGKLTENEYRELTGMLPS